MPIVPNLLERLVFLRLNQGPVPVLDIFGAMAFQTVRAGVDLGALDALSGGALTPSELARRMEAGERGTTVLLEALAALG